MWVCKNDIQCDDELSDRDAILRATMAIVAHTAWPFYMFRFTLKTA